MKLHTGFFVTICTQRFPQVQVLFDPEVFDEAENTSSGLTNTLVEFLGMPGNSIAGMGPELDRLVKLQDSNGLRLEPDDKRMQVQIFYVKAGDEALLNMVLDKASEATWDAAKIFTASIQR